MIKRIEDTAPSSPLTINKTTGGGVVSQARTNLDIATLMRCQRPPKIQKKTATNCLTKKNVLQNGLDIIIIKNKNR